MHKDYWEAKQDKLELATSPEADDPSLHLLKVEEFLKRSLELEATKEVRDCFNGKLTRDDIRRLVVRLKMLKRNMEVKGKVLKATMYEPSLLVFLARRVPKFLLKLQAHWRARRPKEKQKGAPSCYSTWTHLLLEKARLLQWNLVTEEHSASIFADGRTIQDHKRKFFKENFKPP